MTHALTQIPNNLFAFMQVPRLVQLTTLDPATQGPFVNTLSWVLARRADAVRLMGDMRTRFMQNLQADPRVALTVLGAGSAWTIYGQAEVLAERVPVGPLHLALVQITGLQVYAVLFRDAVLTQVPQWDVTGARADAERLDAAVFTAMMTYPG